MHGFRASLISSQKQSIFDVYWLECGLYACAYKYTGTVLIRGKDLPQDQNRRDSLNKVRYLSKHLENSWKQNIFST